MSLLSEQDIDQALTDSPWERDGDTIAREREFDDFRAAIGFVNQVAEAAESANHHPDILVHGYNKVRLTLTSHDAGGVTQSDIDMAGTLDGVG